MHLATLWYLGYGFDYTSGECRGGPDSTGWEREWERVLTPEPGYYCAADPEYIEWAVEHMRQARIDTILLSWNGWGDVDFDDEIEAPDFQANNRAVRRVFHHVRDEAPEMRVAILVEPFFTTAGIRPEKLARSQMQRILDYVWETRWYYTRFSAGKEFASYPAHGGKGPS